MRLFMVKSQVIIEKGTKKRSCAVPWMKESVSYPVLDVYKYSKTDKETEKKTIITKFLVGDSENGHLAWLDARFLNFAGE